MDIKSPVAEARNEYTYSASGAKLKVVQKWNPDYNTAPVIGSAINTALLTMTKTTEYIGNIIYENSALKRILVDGGYIEGGVYYYYLSDHQGNNRVVINASGTAIQRNHYYPFGTAYAENTVAEQGKQPYKYNGKELDQMHGLNLYDYSARFKDDFRFITVDPLAEKYPSISPYAYCNNNPLKYIDPMGMSYTYNWDKNRYEDSKGNEVEWQTVYDNIKDGDPSKEKQSHFELEKRINDNNIPSPVASLLHSYFFTGDKEHSKNTLYPVAMLAEVGFDVECFPYGAFKTGVGTILILRGKEKGQFHGQYNLGIGTGAWGVSGGHNGTFYFYIGDISNFGIKSLEGLSGEVNVSLDGVYGALSANMGFSYSQDQYGGYVIGISGGYGLGTAPFVANGYATATYTTTWGLPLNIKRILDYLY